MNNLSAFEAIKKSVENDENFFDKDQRKYIVQLANLPRKKKEAMKKIIEIANKIVNGPECNVDNSIINYAWCGPVSENTHFELLDSGVGCYINDEYCDFDECSYTLYTWIANRCNQKLEEIDPVISKKIVGFKVATRGDKGVKNYQFALKAILNEKEYKEEILSGDWLINWDTVREKLKKEKRSVQELVCEVHTIKWHTMWPCYQVEGKQTINQIRKNVNISDTLIILESCYKNGFDREEAIRNDVITITKKDEGTISKAVQLLIEGFCRYKKWFTLFGEKEEGYKNYIEFWELESFE